MTARSSTWATSDGVMVEGQRQVSGGVATWVGGLLERMQGFRQVLLYPSH